MVVQRLLGVPKYQRVAQVMRWGGCLLWSGLYVWESFDCETNVLPGVGKLIDRSAGEVMQESAHAALVIYVHMSDFKLQPAILKNNDFHIHIPQGAIPRKVLVQVSL